MWSFNIDYENMSSNEIKDFYKSVENNMDDDEINIKKEFPLLIEFEDELNKLHKQKHDYLIRIIDLKDDLDKILNLAEKYCYVDDNELLKLDDEVTKEDFKNKMNMKIDSYNFQIEQVTEYLKELHQRAELRYLDLLYLFKDYNKAKKIFFKKHINV